MQNRIGTTKAQSANTRKFNRSANGPATSVCFARVLYSQRVSEAVTITLSASEFEAFEKCAEDTLQSVFELASAKVRKAIDGVILTHRDHCEVIKRAKDRETKPGPVAMAVSLSLDQVIALEKLARQNRCSIEEMTRTALGFTNETPAPMPEASGDGTAGIDVDYALYNALSKEADLRFDGDLSKMLREMYSIARESWSGCGSPRKAVVSA